LGLKEGENEGIVKTTFETFHANTLENVRILQTVLWRMKN